MNWTALGLCSRRAKQADALGRRDWSDGSGAKKVGYLQMLAAWNHTFNWTYCSYKMVREGKPPVSYMKTQVLQHQTHNNFSTKAVQPRVGAHKYQWMVEILNLEAVLTPRIALLPAFPQIVKISPFRFALAWLSLDHVPCSHGSGHALRVHLNRHSCTGQQRAILWKQLCHSRPAGFALCCAVKEYSDFFKVWITRTWNSITALTIALPDGTDSLYMCSYSGPQPPADKA